MKSFGPIFERLVDSWPKPVDDIATGLGVTRGHVYNLKKKESVDLSMLDKVCRYFKVSPIMFFDNDILKYSMGARDESQEFNNTAIIGQATMNVGLMGEVENLKAIIAEKERFIQFLLNGKEAAKGVSL